MYKYTYAHPKYSDASITDAKRLYAQYITKYNARTAIGMVAQEVGISYSDAASCIATKKKEVNMDLTTQVHECFKEMMKNSRSKHFAIMDVCDRMRLDYNTVAKLVEKEVLIQLTLF